MKKRKIIDFAVAAVLLIIILISLPLMKTVLISDGVTSKYVYAIMGEPSGDLGSGARIPYWNLPFGFQFVTSIMPDGRDHVAKGCDLVFGDLERGDTWITKVPPYMAIVVPLLLCAVLLGVYLIIRKKYL